MVDRATDPAKGFSESTAQVRYTQLSIDQQRCLRFNGTPPSFPHLFGKSVMYSIRPYLARKRGVRWNILRLGPLELMKTENEYTGAPSF